MMRRSIRWNFVGWLLVMLVLGLGGFGGTLYHLVRLSKRGGVDVEIGGIADFLADELRPSRLPRPPGPHHRPGPRGPGKKPPRPRPDLEWGEPEPAPRDRPGSDFDPRWDRREGPKPSRSGEGWPPRHRGTEPGDSAGPPDGPGLPKGFLKKFEADDGAFFAMWRADGSLIREIHLPAGVERPSVGGGVSPAPERFFRDREGFREVVRTAGDAVILVGRSMEAHEAELRSLSGFLFAAGGAILAIGLVGAWFIAKRAIRPIEAMAATVESMSAEDLTRRIAVESTTTELAKLGSVLNTMFDRLEAAFERQAKFTADASHELRTPVSVILAQTALARRRERPAAEYKTAVDACHAAAKRMKSLVDGLLTLARNDAGDLEIEASELDLAPVVEECLELLQPLAVERGVRILRQLAPVTIAGDAGKLAQVVMNLTTNAIHYNRPGGDVRVTLRTHKDSIVLRVADTGVGIAPEHVPGVFDRFYRADSARSRTDGGSGLGLAITRAIVEAHGGTISCESELGKGSVFEVRLPRADSAPHRANTIEEGQEEERREGWQHGSEVGSDSLNAPSS